MFKNGLLLFLVSLFVSCSTYQSTSHSPIVNDQVISEITTNQTSLSKKDVVNFFCYNLTEYFNTYKYYKISSQIYSEALKQYSNSTSKITRRGSVYHVEYSGAAGKYLISFSNSEFPDSEQIFTFRQGTVIGSAIRDKVYDTFTAWIKKMEIALKANNNSSMFSEEISAAVELEHWYNDSKN